MPVAAPAFREDLVADQVRLSHGVSWPAYETELAARGDAPAPRMAFLEGALELMSPSKDHERVKSYLGRLIEAYALEKGIDLSPYGAWTLKNREAASGAEPDECYLVGDQDKAVPDLVIEVVWTGGGLDKLEIYRRLGVGEVWFWRVGVIEAHVLRGDRYERVAQSRLFPGLDLAFVCSLLDRPTVLQAVRALRASLRSKR